MKEDQLQKAVARLLDYSGLTWCHPPNGGNRSAITGANLKAMGAKAGVPDVLIFNRCASSKATGRGYPNGLAIELKVGKNKPTLTQIEWRDKLTKCGWRWECCYTLDEVTALLRECFPDKFTR